jgi:hypothetical protein
MQYSLEGIHPSWLAVSDRNFSYYSEIDFMVLVTFVFSAWSE